MTDPTKLHRLFADQTHENNESRYPVRGVIQSYDGNSAKVLIPSFDGGKSPFPVDYVGANFQPGDLILVCRDEADTYWVVGMQGVPMTQTTISGGSHDAGGGSGGGAGVAGGPGALPKNANTLNSKQQMFAKRLQGNIGLEPAVICGWIISEEPASASQAPNGANNWLNIGAFDAGGWGGGGSNVWSDPAKGADATASFILGRQVNGISSPLKAAASIHSIAASAGKGVDAQVSAIQHSGWASSGYPNLAQVVKQFQ
jgi:hypothetical protein